MTDILFLLLVTFFGENFTERERGMEMSHKTAEDFRRADARERERETTEQNRTEQNRTEREREIFFKKKSAHLNCCRAKRV